MPDVKAVMAFFGYPSASAFMKDWKALSETDKEQIREGLDNGSLTY